MEIKHEHFNAKNILIIFGLALGMFLFNVYEASAQSEAIDIPVIMTESKDWAAIDYKRDIEQGSALDFSFLLDPPAGKYGRVICSGEDFVFEKSKKKIRFYGVCIGFWPNELWSHEASDKLASRLAASGYNAVRLHAHDAAFCVKGAPSYEIDPTAMESFDYLFTALKKRGIYMTMDLYTRRPFKENEIPELPRLPGQFGGDDFKNMLPISDAAMENWKAFVKAYLSHRNVYSGLAWKDDPALISLCLVNENTVFFQKLRQDKTPDIKVLYDKRFKSWLSEKRISPASEEERNSFRARFYLEIFEKAFFKMRDFVRDLGVRQPLSEQNNGAEAPLALSRSQYDYVDNHFYVDFPFFPERRGKSWNLPAQFKNIDEKSRLNHDQCEYFPTRLFGKPFMLTEFNYGYPNPFRGDVGLIIPAYSALQGWNGLFLYEYTHGEMQELLADTPARGILTSSNDPLAMFSMRIGALLFLRGDIKTSEVAFPVIVDEWSFSPSASLSQPWLRYPFLVRDLGLVGRVGSLVTRKNFDPKVPEGTEFLMALHEKSSFLAKDIKTFSISYDNEKKDLGDCLRDAKMGEGLLDLEKRRARSSTGELEIDGMKKTFKAVSSQSEAISFSGGGFVKGNIVEVENMAEPATFLVTTLEASSLKLSKRILIFHLTGSLNSGLKFRSKEMKIVEDLGTLPHLVRRAKAKMSLGLGKTTTSWMLYGLDFSGHRVEKTKLEVGTDGKLHLELDGFATKEPHFAYELIAND